MKLYFILSSNRVKDNNYDRPKVTVENKFTISGYNAGNQLAKGSTAKLAAQVGVSEAALIVFSQ